MTKHDLLITKVIRYRKLFLKFYNSNKGVQSDEIHLLSKVMLCKNHLDLDKTVCH